MIQFRITISDKKAAYDIVVEVAAMDVWSVLQAMTDRESDVFAKMVEAGVKLGFVHGVDVHIEEVA